MLAIKTIQYLDIPIKTRYLFLKHLQRNVHEFALNQADHFTEIGANAQHFHRDKNYKKKYPVLIHGVYLNGFFALRAYTQPGIHTLDCYHQLFAEQFPELCQNTTETTETCTLEKLKKPLIYESKNWIPYRDCKLKNGVYYDTEKQTIANFDARLQGNLRTFLTTICDKNLPRAEKLLQISPTKTTRTALLNGALEIKKHTFQTQIQVDIQLPTLFSIGQNAAYGNGIFQRV